MPFALVLLGAALCLGSDRPVIPMDAPGQGFLLSTSELPLLDAWYAETPSDALMTTYRFEPSRPAILGDRVFVASGRTPTLQIRRLSDGRLIDQLTLDAAVASPLEAVGERGVLVADTEGTVQLLGRGGEQLWSRRISGGTLAPLALAGGQVYINSTNHAVTCLDVESGAERWSYLHEDSRPTSAPPPVFTGARPLVWPGGVLTGFSDGSLVNLDASTGQVLWALRLGEGEFPDVTSAPVWIDDPGLLLVSSFSGPIVALDPETKDERWRVERGMLGDAVLVRDRLYLADATRAVVAVDTLTGEIVWERDLKGGPAGGLLALGGLLLVTDRHGTVQVWDRFNGEVRWTWMPGFNPSGVWHAPATDGSTFVFHTNEGRIQAIRRAAVGQDLKRSQSERRFRPLGG